MNCQNKINYKGGPKENATNSCFAKAINAFLGFPFMLVCGHNNKYVYCNWANKMNSLLKIFKNLILDVLSKHIGDPKSAILLGLLGQDNYFIESREVQTAKGINAPTCDYEMTTIPAHGFSSLSEGIFLAMMLSQIVDPCNFNPSKEILSLRIVLLDDYFKNVDGPTPKYDGEYGAITLNTSKRFGQVFKYHSVCLKSRSSTDKPKKHFLYDAVDDRKESFGMVLMMGNYIPDISSDDKQKYPEYSKDQREEIWRSNVVVIVKENVANPIMFSGNAEKKFGLLKSLFTMYQNVNWENSVVPDQYCD